MRLVFILLSAHKTAVYLRYDAVYWEIEKLSDDRRSQHLPNGFFRGQRARLGAEIEGMVLPHQGAETKHHELEQPVGDDRAQDKDFIGLPAEIRIQH